MQNNRQTAERTQPADDASERANLRPASDRPDAPGQRYHRVSQDEREIPLAQDREGFRHVVELFYREGERGKNTFSHPEFIIIQKNCYKQQHPAAVL